MHRILEESLPLDQLGISTGLKGVIEEATKKNPTERFAAAENLREALSQTEEWSDTNSSPVDD